MKRALLLVALLPALAVAQNTATISYARPATWADGSPLATTVPLTYKFYQGLKGQPKTFLLETSITNYVLPGPFVTGSEYCWTVSAVANGLESIPSVEGCKAFPFVAPAAPVITVR